MKKFSLGLLMVILTAGSVPAQEIKVIKYSKGSILSFGDMVFNPTLVSYSGQGNYVGIYIIEIEGTKYIVNATSGIIKHEPTIKP